eukprot:m.95270 g.95270  ORF g.95270 m.95270 type:complete len:260 (+) comp8596_c0_seq2:2-781(+)
MELPISHVRYLQQRRKLSAKLAASERKNYVRLKRERLAEQERSYGLYRRQGEPPIKQPPQQPDSYSELWRKSRPAAPVEPWLAPAAEDRLAGAFESMPLPDADLHLATVQMAFDNILFTHFNEMKGIKIASFSDDRLLEQFGPDILMSHSQFSGPVAGIACGDVIKPRTSSTFSDHAMGRAYMEGLSLCYHRSRMSPCTVRFVTVFVTDGRNVIFIQVPIASGAKPCVTRVYSLVGEDGTGRRLLDSLLSTIDDPTIRS